MRLGINAQLLAFTEDYRQAGLSRYIYEMVTRLPDALPEDEIVAFVGNGQIPSEVLREAAPNLRFEQSRLPTVQPAVRIVWEQAALPVEALTWRLDLLFSPVSVRPILLPRPAVVTVHDLIFLRYPEKYHPLKRAYLQVMTRWSARHARHVLAVSDATRRDVIRLLGVPPSRVSTVHNGVGLQFKRCSSEDKADFRRAKGIEGRIILYIGTLEPRKNLGMLIESFAAIASEPEFTDVQLLIGGSKGWYYDEIFAAAERLGLVAGERVRFLGRVPDSELPLWYNIATICAYPSLYEGFGLPALEAMACATPVVASNRSALPEVVGRAGMVIDPTDVGAWAGALGRLLREPELRSELAGRGVEQAARFTWERSAQAAADVFREVMAAEVRARGRRVRGRA